MKSQINEITNKWNHKSMFKSQHLWWEKGVFPPGGKYWTVWTMGGNLSINLEIVTREVFQKLWGRYSQKLEIVSEVFQKWWRSYSQKSGQKENCKLVESNKGQKRPQQWQLIVNILTFWKQIFCRGSEGIWRWWWWWWWCWRWSWVGMSPFTSFG